MSNITYCQSCSISLDAEELKGTEKMVQKVTITGNKIAAIKNRKINEK